MADEQLFDDHGEKEINVKIRRRLTYLPIFILIFSFFPFLGEVKR